MPLGELDEEDMPDGDDDLPFALSTSKPRSKSKKRKEGVKTEGEDSKSEGEGEPDADENVFIDNLPKDEQSIKILLKEVNKHIRELER